jgi:hypothetical protein
MKTIIRIAIDEYLKFFEMLYIISKTHTDIKEKIVARPRLKV